MKLLLKSVLVGLAGFQSITLAAESRPKLVVGIMVDQLRTDYLENLRSLLSSGGFKRLMDSGVYIKDLDYGIPGGDQASAAAIIQTGALPRQTGVTGEIIYDQGSKSLRSVFYDDKYIGNFTNETYSPSALRVTTLSDEVSIANRGEGKIHVIAPEAAQALALAGHNANSAFWINNETGRWSSTTYYKNPPVFLQNKNYNDPLSSRIDTMRWMPLYKDIRYPNVSQKDIKNGFKYSFSRSDKDVFKNYKQSPYLNSDVTAAATDYILNLSLGSDSEKIDVLNLGYSLAPYPGIRDDDYSYELQDAYLRLDKDLERLLNTLDRQVGRDNVMVYLMSSGYFEEPAIKDEKFRIPAGSFSVKRALSLLNAFLSAKYGNDSYVDTYSNGHIYLAKKVIEHKGLDLSAVTKEGRDFLTKMSGVSGAYTLSDLINPSYPKLEGLSQSIDPRTAGDIILEFTPGWTVTDDSKYPAKNEKLKSNAYFTPGFILGAEFAPQIIEETVDATAIAPTLAQGLHIRSPNAAAGKPLKLKNK